MVNAHHTVLITLSFCWMFKVQNTELQLHLLSYGWMVNDPNYSTIRKYVDWVGALKSVAHFYIGTSK